MENRVIVILKDKDGKIIKRKAIALTLTAVLRKLGIACATQKTDKITIESEEI